MKNKYGHHRIYIDEELLARLFDEMMDEMFLLYHTHPTNIIQASRDPYDLEDPGLYAGDIVSYAGGK